MQLTELAEEITAHLNEDVSLWTNQSVVAKTAHDPYKCIDDKLGVYVVPLFNDYIIAKSNARRKVRSIWKNSIILIVVSQIFKEIPLTNTVGIANWSEAKTLLNTREAVEKTVMDYYNSLYRLADIDSEEAEEIESNSRKYVALTTFIYEASDVV